MIRLGDVAVGRDNNVRLIRHVAALAVILFHCYALNLRWPEDPLARLFPGVDLGSLGVQVFFALSGYLVTQSWCEHPSLRAFVLARALRIYPALVAATVVTIVVAGVSSTLAWPDYLAAPQTLDYLWRTASGLTGTLMLPEVFTTNPFPRAPNGSLWTLPVELRLYVGVLVAGALGVLARRPLALGAAVVAALALVYVPWPVSLWIDSVRIRSLAIIFVCGMLAFVWRSRIPLSRVAAAVALALYLTLPASFTRAVAILPLIAYVTLVAAFHPRLRIARFARGADFSYGLYVYAFPIQQLLLWRWPGLGIAPLFLVATPAIAAVAAMSWYGLERPALAWKKRLQGAMPQPASAIAAAPHAPTT
jgi:peptidoglycan/LPS O-acetylase OafA/YrhL